MVSVGCVAVGGSGAGSYVERDEKRFSVQGKPDVTLSTMDGSIEIRSWDRPDVLVVVERRGMTKEAAAAVEVQSRQEGNHVTVEVRSSGARSWFLGWGQEASLIVSVPAASDVRARSGDGAISVEHVSGTIALRSGDGSIRGRAVSGAISVGTGDGSISLDEVDGTLEAATGDGRVDVSGRLTALHARSGDGSIRIHAQPGSATSADWDITSGDGSVTLEIPDSFGAELDAHTGDGRIDLTGITLSNVTGEIGRNRASGRIGPGGHAVRVRTGDGPITLRRF